MDINPKSLHPLRHLSVRKRRNNLEVLENGWKQNFQFMPSKDNDKHHKFMRVLFERPLIDLPDGTKTFVILYDIGE